MKAFHVLWWSAAATVLVTGSFLAVLAVPLTALVTLAVAATMAIGLGARIVDEQHRRRRPAARYLRIAAPGLIVGPAVGGLIAALSWIGVLVLALVVVSSPWVVRSLLLRFVPKPSQAEPKAIEAKAVPSVQLRCPAEPADLPDEELFNAWQLSYVLLQHALTTHDRIALVTIRQRYLDELERRNPAGFRLWMANGARAASNPRRYLSS